MRARGGIIIGPRSVVEPPAATSEAVAAGGTPSNKTFGAFADDDGVIASYSSAIEAAVGTITATDGGDDDTLGPWAYSGATDGDSWVHVLRALDSSGNIVASAEHQVDVASASGAGWETVAEVDYSTDITDLTLTPGAGDTVLFAADGVTPKATLNAVTRVSTPTTAVARVTASDGGLYVRAQKDSAAAVDVNWKLTSSDVDFSDFTGIIAVDLIITSPSMGALNDKWGAGLSNNTGIVVDDSHIAQMVRGSGPAYTNRAIRTIGGSSAVTTTPKDSQASAYGAAVRVIVYANQVVAVYVARGQTTFLSGFPTQAGVVSEHLLGTPAVNVESAIGIYGSPFYVAVEALTGASAGGDASFVCTRQRIQRYR